MLHDLITALVAAEWMAGEIGEADVGIAGEMSVSDHDRLRRDLDSAVHAKYHAVCNNDRLQSVVK